MKRRVSISGMIVLAGVFLSFACTDMPTTPVPDPGASESVAIASKKGKGPFPEEIPLELEFVDRDMRSDLEKGGEFASIFYTDGVDKVRAVFRSNGNLNFDSAQLKKNETPDRLVCVTVVDNLGVVYPVDDQPACVDATLNTNAIFEGDPVNKPDVVLGEMEPGDVGSTTAASRWSIGDTQYILRFGRKCNNTATSGSDLDHFVPANRAVATRDADADTWTLVGGAAYFCEIKLKKGKGSGESSIKPVRGETGEASASFEVTLTLKE